MSTEVKCDLCKKPIKDGIVNRDLYVVMESHLRTLHPGRSGTETSANRIFDSKQCMLDYYSKEQN